MNQKNILITYGHTMFGISSLIYDIMLNITFSFTDMYVNCTYITHKSTRIQSLYLETLFVVVCMERGDNLINFQRKEKGPKTKEWGGGSNITLRNIEKYPIVWANVKCQSLLEHCKSLFSSTLSCIFHTGRLLKQNCVSFCCMSL